MRWNIREDVAGCSIMAFGSAAPEILINVIGTAKGGSGTDLGVGAIIGSGMIAFLVIPGACALAASKTLQLKQRPLLRDATVYLVALGLLVAFFADGVIRTWEASCLVLLYVLYILGVFFAPGVHQHYQAFTHRKKLWLSMRRAVTAGVRGRDLLQLRESFLEVEQGHLQAANGQKHFVQEAAEQKERERLEELQRTRSPQAQTQQTTTRAQQQPDVELQERKSAPVITVGDSHDSALDEELSSPSDGVAHIGSGATSGGASGSGSSSIGGGAHRYDTVDSEPDLEASQPSKHHALSTAPRSSSSLSASGDTSLGSGGDENVNDPDDEDDNGQQGEGEGEGQVAHSSAVPSDSPGATGTVRALEAPPTRLGEAYRLFVLPLNWAFDRTCIACEWDSATNARYYPLTFLVSFLWVSFFSFLVSVIVGRWVARSQVSQSFFGIILVAMGAEIPDLIQSVTVITFQRKTLTEREREAEIERGVRANKRKIA